MYKLGITGGIGSGKSTAANFFKKKDAVIFDADEEAKYYLQSTISLQNRIVDNWGNQVTTHNKLDLNKLAEIVFSDKENQQIINQLLWPEVYVLMSQAAKEATANKAKIFVVDAAMLFESEYSNYFDSILLVTASKSIRKKRILLRNNIPENQINKRMSFQMPEAEKKQLAHFIIENNGNESGLYKKLEIFYDNINLV